MAGYTNIAPSQGPRAIRFKVSRAGTQAASCVGVRIVQMENDTAAPRNASALGASEDQDDGGRLLRHDMFCIGSEYGAIRRGGRRGVTPTADDGRFVYVRIVRCCRSISAAGRAVAKY